VQSARQPIETGPEVPAGQPGVIQTILVVDDSPAQLRLMSNILKRWGYKVVEADSADVALERLATGGIDLVLSDWVMPGKSGIDLCQEFRARADDTYVYFILLTSKSSAEDVAQGLQAGADDFLRKPIDRSELRARIHAGERLLKMQRAVVEKNRLLETTLGHLQSVYDRIAQDLLEARRLQQSLVPDRERTYPGAQVAFLLQPSEFVGGDLVGAFMASENQLAVYSIDVSGHGVASALLNARLAGYLSEASPDHNLALETRADGTHTLLCPREICTRLNTRLIADLETELYFTMSFAAIDLTSGNVTLAQAGHPNPMVERASGEVEFIGDGGMPIGLIEEASFGLTTLKLEPGDRLLLYTDGFTEQTDANDEMLDEDGLTRLVASCAGISGASYFDALVWSLSDFAGEAEFADDLSGALIEFEGAP
jgi:sigma-B regulation protein RsbU (phosphoserine phosphatase)